MSYIEHTAASHSLLQHCYVDFAVTA